VARKLNIEFSDKQSEAYNFLNQMYCSKCGVVIGIGYCRDGGKGKHLCPTCGRIVKQNNEAVELCYGGAKYGGKSWFGSDFCFLECIRIIKDYKIKRQVDPIPVGFMGRKVGKDFYDTTFETWKKAIPSSCYKLKGKPVEIIIEGRVKMFTGGLDRTETINKFNSAELALYFLDQAEETQKDEISLLRAATFWRLSINGRKVPGKGLLTANPAQCWLKPEFIDVVGDNG